MRHACKGLNGIGEKVAAALLLVCVFLAPSHALAIAPVCTQVETLLAQISITHDAIARSDKEDELVHLIRARPECGERPATMDHISVLLADPDDGTRSTAAECLGLIGPPAMRTVPALEKARKLSDSILDADPSPMLPTQYSGQAIRWALRQIRHRRIPEYNEEPGRMSPAAHPVPL
jgi:hypothetical protein